MMINTFFGKAKNVLQVGTIHGGLHIHFLGRIGSVILVILVGVPLILTIVTQLNGNSTQRPSAEPPTTSIASGTASHSSDVPPVHQRAAQDVTINLYGTKQAPVGDITIHVDTVAVITVGNGRAQASNGGDSNFAIFGGGKASGGSTIGTVDFSVLTPTMTCEASGLHIGESVVITEPSDEWIRIAILSISQITQRTPNLPVTFEVSLGQGSAPQSSKVCSKN
jgi:hypothetical protein